MVDRSGDGWDQRLYWERHAAAAGEPYSGPDERGEPTDAVPTRTAGSPAATVPASAAGPVHPPAPSPQPPAPDQPARLADRTSAVANQPVADLATSTLRGKTLATYDADPPAFITVPSDDDRDSSPRPARSLPSRLVRAGAMTVLVVAVATAVAYVTRPEREVTTADPGRPSYPVQDPNLTVDPGFGGPVAAGETPTPTPSESVDPSPFAAAAPTPSRSAQPSTGTSTRPATTTATRPATTTSTRSGTTTTGPATGPTTTTPAVVTAPAAGQTVQLVNLGTGGYVGVAGNASHDGASVVQTYHSSWASTRWRLQNPSPAKAGCFVLVQAGTNKALDVRDWGEYDGTPMQIWTVDGTSKQTWCLESIGGGWYSLQNQYAYRLLDLRDGSTAEGATIQHWGAVAYEPNQNQTWRLLLVS